MLDNPEILLFRDIIIESKSSVNVDIKKFCTHDEGKDCISNFDVWYRDFNFIRAHSKILWSAPSISLPNSPNS